MQWMRKINGRVLPATLVTMLGLCVQSQRLAATNQAPVVALLLFSDASTLMSDEMATLFTSASDLTNAKLAFTVIDVWGSAISFEIDQHAVTVIDSTNGTDSGDSISVEAMINKSRCDNHD